jgi:hypothetical protein
MGNECTEKPRNDAARPHMRGVEDVRSQTSMAVEYCTLAYENGRAWVVDMST